MQFVAGCAQIAAQTAVQTARLIDGHWEAMFVDKKWEVLLNEMRELEARTKEFKAPLEVQERIRI